MCVSCGVLCFPSFTSGSLQRGKYLVLGHCEGRYVNVSDGCFHCVLDGSHQCLAQSRYGRCRERCIAAMPYRIALGLQIEMQEPV